MLERRELHFTQTSNSCWFFLFPSLVPDKPCLSKPLDKQKQKRKKKRRTKLEKEQPGVEV
uniref:Uncharacterized protein n=1 Tax=Nelumbo nucifera TaxID=4432 RepID=A0A822ZIS4_NELNU|nr:TPA_asm: hypothetical protein HUJ06_001499 [Nelumbo nucifera]